MPPATIRAPRPAVAIPIYKHELSAAESLSIDRAVKVLARRDLCLVGPARLQDCMAALCKRHGSPLQYKLFDDRFFSGITAYNALMRSKVFYRSFAEFSHVLISQTDALVLSDDLDRWCGLDFSYVGAPWFVGGSTPVQPLQFLGVGNGDFSLRNVSDFLRVLSAPRRVPNVVKSRSGGATPWSRRWRWFKHEWWFAYTVEPFFPTSNEDVFWGVLVPRAFPFFRVPTPEQAIGFAFEVAPRLLYEMNGRELPFGCHAWERCDKAFWAEKLSFLQPGSEEGTPPGAARSG